MLAGCELDASFDAPSRQLAMREDAVLLEERQVLVLVHLLQRVKRGPQVQQAAALFEARKSERFDGFEVWDGKRRVHVHPPVPGAVKGSANDGNQDH